jgi:hypothetical protein
MRALTIVLILLLAVALPVASGCGSHGEAVVLPAEVESAVLLQPAEVTTSVAPHLVHPGDFEYLGAFRLPGGTERPRTFAYGGEAMTFNPNGGLPGPRDGLTGSLFVMGHNRMPYGELPNGNQVAEISIPVPIISRNINALNRAEFIQPFNNIAAGHFTSLVEIPRAGMEYLDNPATGPRIHLAFGQHFQEDPSVNVASHAWFNFDLSTPYMQGPWHIGRQSLYSVNDYLFAIPAEWAREHAQSRFLATGRYRDGGWSGMGPALFAYWPWVDAAGTPAAPNSRLRETVLLLYENTYNTNNIERYLNGYQHPDEWTGGAWVTTASGKSAVLFAGTKSTGDRYWYGFINPAGPQHPCIEEAYIGQFTLCRLADGTPCGNERAMTCSNPASVRGWWSSSFKARIILYDPDDLARVAAGDMEPWQPQPYAFFDFDEYLYFNPSGVERETLGWGPQRRYRLGDVAYDRENGLLYILELFADGAKPVVHVWQIHDAGDRVRINLKRRPATGGSVSGSGLYEPGDPVLARAIEGEGFTFVGWTEGLRVVSASSNYSFFTSTNRMLVANFSRDPSTVALRLPVNRSPERKAVVQFRWNPVEGAIRYQIQVRRADDKTIFTNRILGPVIGCNFRGFALDGTTYIWRVRARNEEGWGRWTPYRSFTSRP